MNDKVYAYKHQYELTGAALGSVQGTVQKKKTHDKNQINQNKISYTIAKKEEEHNNIT